MSLEPFFDQWKRVNPAFRPADPEAKELARIPASPIPKRKRTIAALRSTVRAGDNASEAAVERRRERDIATAMLITKDRAYTTQFVM